MARNFLAEIDSSYPIPGSICVMSGNDSLDIRDWCDTVADFETAATGGFELRRDGLITYEKSTQKLKLCKESTPGSFTWVEIGKGTEVVNDLTTGGTDKALSAEQGKSIKSQLDEIKTTVSKLKDLSPYYIEGFISFNKWGIGTPSGLSNYPDNNYVVIVSGNIGDSFVTINSGDISHGGGMWHCIINTSSGYIHNKVIGIEGNKFLLLKPLTSTFTNCLLSNMQDEVNGQHFTQEGYYAYANHINNYNPKHADREKWLYQFKNTDTTGKWSNNGGYLAYNYSKNINEPVYNTYYGYGKQYMLFDFTSINSYLEWEVSLNEKIGYLECFVGTEKLKNVIAEFYLDDVLVDSKVFDMGTKLIFDYKEAKKGKIRFKVTEWTERFTLRIGTTTWWENREKYNKTMLGNYSKLAYIGDSWGEFQNKATTRELTKILGYDVSNYSKGGHTCKYASHWFDEYIIKNTHDAVIIEYFTNDFNSINGTVQPTFTGVDGQQHDMNLSSISEYVSTMNGMIEKCIDNGIQPIVILPFSTNSSGQAQGFSDYAQQIFQGKSSLVENLEIKTIISEEISTNKIETTEVRNESTTKLVSNEMIQSLRKGVVATSDVNVTAGNIFTCVNNNVSVAGIDYRGVVKSKGELFTPFPTSQSTASYNRGLLYLVNNTITTGGIDELRIVIQLADGTFKEKKIQLIDV